MEPFGVLLVIFGLAFLVESLVEYLVGTPFDMIPALKPYKWTLMYISMGVGIAGALVYRFDVLALLAQYVKVEINTNIFGVVLTGMMIGRGANYVHDFVMKFFKQPPSAALQE